jgi:hypothetical protein
VSTKSLRGFKNCGAQTNWASHMRFAADYSETLEVFFLPPTDNYMTWRPVSGMRSRLFQRTCSTEHYKSSNIVWTFSVLPREPTSRSTEGSKKLPEFHCNLSQTACVSICLRATIFQNPEGTLWTHCIFINLIYRRQ